MEIIRLDKDDRINFQQALERQLASLKRRQVSYTISPHSNEIATVRISVSGKNGDAGINMVVFYDNLNWNVVSMGNKYVLTNGFSELSTIARRLLSTVIKMVNKI